MISSLILDQGHSLLYVASTNGRLIAVSIEVCAFLCLIFCIPVVWYDMNRACQI